jgi:Transposase DDE domain
VRVVESRLEGITDAEPLYRVVTTILDPQRAPAAELAALYHERWEIEVALAELKTGLRGVRAVLRSKTPELVRQEVWGLLLAHFAVRGLMHEAALQADEDPDRLSFSHAVRVVRRKIPQFAALSPSGQACPASGGADRDPGRARSEWSRSAGATRGEAQDEQLPAAAPRTAADHPR